MLIEKSPSDAVRFFHMNALSSAVGLKVDFDMSLLVIASGLYRILAERMRGYEDSQARLIFRDLVDSPATVTVADTEVEINFHRRSLVGRPQTAPDYPCGFDRVAKKLGELGSVEIQASPCSVAIERQ